MLLDDRNKTRKTWEMLHTPRLVEAAHKARDLGWKENKVQVRLDNDTYYVEPYEKDCGCKGLLRYNDYFD